MGLFHPKPLVHMNTQQIGERGVQFIISRLIGCGYIVLVPVGEGARYDLVIQDADGNFWRVQCKSGRLVRNKSAIDFNCFTVKKDGKMSLYDASQVDYFAVYCRDLDKAYLVPFGHAGVSRGNLRLGSKEGVYGKRGFIKEARFAEDYEI